MRLSLFLISLFLLSSVDAQVDADSITLLNGRTYSGTNTKITGDILTSTISDKKGDYAIQLELNRIFSLSSNKKETVFYKQDELQGDYLTVAETRQATWGSRDARITSKPRFVGISSGILSFGFSLFDTYLSSATIKNMTKPGDPSNNLTPGLFKANPSLLQFLVPTGFALAWALPSFKVKERKILQKGMKGNQYYYGGYNRIAKQKRMFAALAGGAIGSALGLISYGLFKQN